MAFTVTREYHRYRISIGDRRPVLAANVGEIKRALSHYYGDEYRESYRFSHACGDDPKCPFCRAMRG